MSQIHNDIQQLVYSAQTHNPASSEMQKIADRVQEWINSQENGHGY